MWPPPDGSAVVSDDMPVPASGPLTTELVVEAETVRLVAAVPPPDDALEDNWLTIAQFAAFLPPGHEPGFEPGEEQFMPRKKGKVLEIEAISVEQPFLFELLDLLAGGRLGEYRIEAS